MQRIHAEVAGVGAAFAEGGEELLDRRKRRDRSERQRAATIGLGEDLVTADRFVDVERHDVRQFAADRLVDLARVGVRQVDEAHRRTFGGEARDDRIDLLRLCRHELADGGRLSLGQRLVARCDAHFGAAKQPKRAKAVF